MTPCPGEETLRLLLEDRLGEGPGQAVTDHVQACAGCQQALAALANSLGDLLPPLADANRTALNPPACRGSPAAPAGVLPQVPGYEVLGEVGRGGMGVVYKARQREPQRLVALKMLRQAAAADGELVRFRGEARALAALRHPHVVQVFEVGQAAGQPYFSLEYLEDGSLAGRLDGTPLPARAAARLAELLAGAVQAAHQAGIVHRDLKPANVLLARSGRPEAVALGGGGVAYEPKVADFGLAKWLDPAGSLTSSSGAVLGTPNYMAPEQAQGKGKEAGPAADIYALGAILYELLTGRPPFRGETALDTLAQVVYQDPVPPARLNPKVPRDLQTVCLKCLEKQPARRYASAQELADDLRRFLAHEPIRARPIGPVGRLGKWARRRPAAAALWAVCVGVGLLTAGGALWWISARAARQAETGRAVERELAEASRQRGRAGEPDDPTRWSAALAAAKRAQALAEQAEGLGEEIRQRADDLVGELEAEGRDRHMLRRLDGIRLRQGEVKDGHFDTPRTDEDYEKTFRAYGIDVDKSSPEEAAALIRARPIRQELAAAVDNWAAVRRGKAGEASPRWRRLLAVARRADPDPWRNRLRAALEKGDVRALRTLARGVPVGRQPASTLVWLADVLHPANPGAAVGLLRRALPYHRGDFWLNTNLALYLTELRPPRLEEALPYYTAALALRPDSPGAFLNFGYALNDKGQFEEAVAAYREAIRLKKDFAGAYYNLGIALHNKGDWRGAEAAYRRAIALAPKRPDAHLSLGLTLRAQGDPAGAVAEFKKAIALDPKRAEAHNNLGLTLRAQGDLAGAVAEYRKAIALDPKLATSHYNLGNLLLRKGRLGEAAAAYRRAIALDPKNMKGHYNLGNALQAQGDVPGAEAAYRRALALDPLCARAHCGLGKALQNHGDFKGAAAAYRRAIALDPKDATAHYNLGNALCDQGDLAGAAAAYRRAIALYPKDAEAHCNLGEVLRRQGRLQESLAAYRRGHELGSRQRRWPYSSHQWVRQAERLAELDKALPAFLEGRRRPRSAAERRELIEVCRWKRRFASATRFYGEAFAADPKLAEELSAGHRYNAACAAALAGCGQGKDTAPVDRKERARLRSQALVWLRADLAAWRRVLQKDPEKSRATVRLALRHWQADTDLAGVRGNALDKLVEAEGEEWQRLWSDVAALVRQ
jgi:serine/threonine-protein kinase